jgi:hypothetical protein
MPHRLRERVDLDADLLGAGRREERRRLVAVEHDLRVGHVVDDEDVVRACEVDDLLEEAVGHHGAGRVVRVVEVHQLRPADDVGVERTEVGHESALGLERHQDRLGSREPGPAGVDGVAGVGGQRVVARVQEGEVEIEDRLLGADRRDDLAVGVEVDVEAAEVEVVDRVAEVLAAAVGGVLVRFGLADRLLHRLDDQRRRRAVRVADAERDHVDARRALVGDLALKLCEGVRRDLLEAATRFHAAPFRTRR